MSAQFAFDRGIVGTFTSRGRLREQVGHWGIELVGSKGSARVLADIWPNVFVQKPAAWTADGRHENWTPLEGDPGREPKVDKTTTTANRRVVEDLLASIRDNREPACSARNATKALEMVMAIHQSALSGKRAPFPLADRSHPLKTQT